MCPILVNKEKTSFTVGELKEYLSDRNDELPVNIYVMKETAEGVRDVFILPLEAMGANGEEISLTCYDT